ncbi:unnamed protein product [Rhizoctonia solani]|uniref:VWFA domain-containing protein n=1 Tax=Rhizoctonia solani TaxID=456999 RepID=A0A8H3BL11_9AGAM|nr:unnamed protein product [Rhizoctonia solani]
MNNLGHSQALHKTSHGSMIGGRWIIEAQSAEGADPAYEIDNQIYGQGDEGTTMFCHMMCTKQGRHVHVDFCRDPENHEQPLCKHVPAKPSDTSQAKDWISHATYWERTGFEDPYSKAEQSEFSKCNYYCPGLEHEGEDRKSWCTLPIFHPPQGQNPRAKQGYTSKDGHHFGCADPSLGYHAYHVVFLVDTSGSMWGNDKRPVPDLPITNRLVQECNNRYGAAISALYCFWTSQAKIASRSLLNTRKDAYTLVTFDDKTKVKAQNDLNSTAEQLVNFLLPQQSGGWFSGTSFDEALKTAGVVIEQNWSNERAPVIVILSDGESSVSDELLNNLCNTCIQRGHALSFYSILFGQESYSSSLRKMVDLAEASFRAAPLSAKSNFTGRDIPCKYSNAIDSVQLMDKFLGISEAISDMRASVINPAGASGRCI